MGLRQMHLTVYQGLKKTKEHCQKPESLSEAKAQKAVNQTFLQVFLHMPTFELSPRW